MVSSVQARPSVSRRCPRPRPTAVSNSIHASSTPSAPVGGSAARKSRGSVVCRVASSRSRTPSGPSAVVMFQLKATRSRQKHVGANSSTARSTSRAVSAAWNSASQRVTRVPGSSSSVVVGAGSRVWVTVRLLRRRRSGRPVGAPGAADHPAPGSCRGWQGDRDRASSVATVSVSWVTPGDQGCRTSRIGLPSLRSSRATPSAASVSGRVAVTERAKSIRRCRTSCTSSATCAGVDP